MPTPNPFEPPESPPFPLPEWLHEQMRLGLEALDLLDEILAVTGREGLDDPWLPATILDRLVGLLAEREQRIDAVTERYVVMEEVDARSAE